MIYGKPYEFAIFYDVLEKTDDERWKYGLFNFFIEDEAYPSKGSNYTLDMVVKYLKDSRLDINLKSNIKIRLPENITDVMAMLAHSHELFIDTDPEGFEFSESEPLGVFLSPLEIADVGFYLFYYFLDDGDNEYLVYSSDYGCTVKQAIFKKGTVYGVIESLPDKICI